MTTQVPTKFKPGEQRKLRRDGLVFLSLSLLVGFTGGGPIISGLLFLLGLGMLVASMVVPVVVSEDQTERSDQR